MKNKAILYTLLLSFAVLLGNTSFFSLSSSFSDPESRLNGFYVDDSGRLQLLARVALELDLKAEVIWSLQSFGEDLLVMAGHEGQVFLLDSELKIKKSIQLDAVEVLCALALSDDEVLFGTGPRGKVYSYNLKKDKAELVAEIDEDYVWTLTRAGKDIFLGSGLPARLYRLDKKENEAVLLSSLDDDHLLNILSLEEDLLLATANSGKVYRYNEKQDSQKLLLDLDGRGIQSLKKRDDTRFIGITSGKKMVQQQNSDEMVFYNELFLLNENGTYQQVHEFKNKTLMAMHLEKDAVFLSTSSGDIYRYVFKTGNMDFIQNIEGKNLGAMLAWKDQILMSSSVQTELLSLQAASRGEGTFISPVLGSGNSLRFGKVHYLAENSPENLEIATRSGNSAADFSTWSDWENVKDSVVASPDARFLQLKVEAPGRDASAPVFKLQELQVYYAQKKQDFFTIREAYAGRNTSLENRLKLNLKDYQFFIHWSYATAVPPGARAALYYKHSDMKHFKPLPGQFFQSPLVLDSDLFLEGHYKFKIVVYADASEKTVLAEKTTAVYLNDLQAPQLLSVDWQASTLKIVAQDSLSPIAVFSLSWESRGLQDYEPEDGLFDEKVEEFSLNLPEEPVDYAVVYLRDYAGNVFMYRIKPRENQ